MSESHEKTNAKSTMDRVRSQRAPFGDLTSRPIHRVRGGAAEIEMAAAPWCGAKWQEGERLSTRDGNVTCPGCLEIIAKRKGHPAAGLAVTHFICSNGGTLCGDEPRDLNEMVDSLRETRCEKCLDAAENLLIGLITGAGKSKMDLAFEKVVEMVNEASKQREYHQARLEQEEESSSALRDIAEMLKQILNLWRGEAAADDIERGPESPAAASN